MIDLVDYYEGALASDIRTLSEASGGDFSIVAFVDPAGPAPGPGMQRRFHALPAERQVAFLMGYHFCVLLDQGLHEAIRPHHPRFEAVARYPKLRGILASYHTNMHPALLLGVASAVVHEEEIDATTEALRALSGHVVEEYARFLAEDFADLTRTPRGEEARVRLVLPVFRSLSSAYALLSRPSVSGTAFPFRSSPRPPRPELYAAWCGFVQADVHRVGGGVGAWS